MVFKRVNEISFENAKKAVKVIIDVLNEFLDSIEKIYPNIGYGELVKTLTLLQSNVKLSTGPFLSSTEINENVSLLFEIFSTMNDDLKNNLQKLFEAYREITSFIFSNNANIDVKLLDFQHSRIEDIKINNKHLNDALMKMKDSNYTDETLLRSLFSIFSSIVETSEELHRKELNSHCDKINTFSKSKKLSYIFPYDPIDVFGIGGVVSRKDKKGTYTKQRAIRHLLDHHHFKIDSENHQIHFKSPKNDSKWKFINISKASSIDLYLIGSPI